LHHLGCAGLARVEIPLGRRKSGHFRQDGRSRLADHELKVESGDVERIGVPVVISLADDRANEYKRQPDKIGKEVEKRLKLDLRKEGEFSRIHPLPQSGQDVPDDMDSRLVVLDIEHAYSKDAESPAMVLAKSIFESRGNTPRLYRNTLVFLAVDQARLQDLEEALARYLAWESIINDQTMLNLQPSQVKQAEGQMASADGAVTARLPEAYQWLIVPAQANPQAAIEWQAIRLSGQDPLAVRASKKLRNDDSIVPNLAGTSLKDYLDRIPLWRGNHVPIKLLAEDFARYLYLPRLTDTNVLLSAISDGVRLLTWINDSFAYADSFDEASNRYRGLRGKESINGILVKPDVAYAQLEAETKPGPGTPVRPPDTGTQPQPTNGGNGRATATLEPHASPKSPLPKRYHGSVSLDPNRVGRDAGRIADEVISHLVGQVGADVRVTLEIQATMPSGVPDNVVRIVTENGRTLKFTSHGFEQD
jgi:hypothetical protein